MKYLLTIAILTVTLNCFSQRKDTTINQKTKQEVIADSLPIISWQDIQQTINYFYGKISQEDYNKAQQFYQILWNNAINRKNKKK